MHLRTCEHRGVEAEPVLGDRDARAFLPCGKEMPPDDLKAREIEPAKEVLSDLLAFCLSVNAV